MTSSNNDVVLMMLHRYPIHFTGSLSYISLYVAGHAECPLFSPNALSFFSLCLSVRPLPSKSPMQLLEHLQPCLFSLPIFSSSFCVLFFFYPIRLMRISYIKTPSPFSFPLHVVSSFTLGFSCITPTSKTQDPSSTFFTSMHFPPGKSRQHGTAEAYCWQCKAVAIT